MVNGYSISRNSVGTAADDIREWLGEIGLAEQDTLTRQARK